MYKFFNFLCEFFTDWDEMPDGTKEVWNVCNIDYWQEVLTILKSK